VHTATGPSLRWLTAAERLTVEARFLVGERLGETRSVPLAIG
jgi:hypothetical protein